MAAMESKLSYFGRSLKVENNRTRENSKSFKIS